jgi:hypothetical protein
MKICTFKFLGCHLAQRVHGSKVEAKESTENSKALELDELKSKSQRRMNRALISTCVG